MIPTTSITVSERTKTKMVQVNMLAKASVQVYLNVIDLMRICHGYEKKLNILLQRNVFKWNLRSTKCNEIWKIILLLFSSISYSHTIYIMYLLCAFGCYSVTSKQTIMEKTKILQIAESKIKEWSKRKIRGNPMETYFFVLLRRKFSSKGSEFREQIYPFLNGIWSVFPPFTCVRPFFAYENGYKVNNVFN